MRSNLREIIFPRLPAVEALAGMFRPDTDARLDESYGDKIDALMAMLRDEWFGKYTKAQLEEMVRGLAGKLEEFNATEVAKMLSSKLKRDVFKSEPWLDGEMRSFVKQNVSLIQGVGTRAAARVEQIIFNGARVGLRHEEIAKILKETLGDRLDNDFDFVARDQVNKFNGQLTMLRQREAGVSRFIWRSLRDSRVRPSHRLMDGVVCDWDDLPVVDGAPAFPGSPWRCRCFAEPNLEDLIE